MAADIVVNFKAADGQFDAGLARIQALLQNSVGQMKTLTGGLASATGAAAAQAGEQAFRFNVAALAQQQRAAQDDWTKRRALMQEELDYIGVMRGQQSAQYGNMLRQIERAEQQHEQQQRQVTARTIESQQQESQAGIAIANEEITFERQMGIISGVEAVQRTQQTEQQKYEIEREALEEKWMLWDQDPIKRANIDRQLERLEIQHGLALKKLQDQQVLESKKQWEVMLQPVNSALNVSIHGVIQGTQTLSQAWRNMAQSIVLSFAQAMIRNSEQAVLNEILQTSTKAAGVAEREGLVVTSEGAQTGAVIAGEAARNTAQAAGAEEGLLIKGTSAIKEIAIDAYKAAAAAYAAIAAIPVIGPVLAPVAAGVALAAVLAFGASIASAEGGYDIPAGVNPMTQLHQNEMVLPAPLADRVRTMTAGGGAGPVHLHVHAVDAKSVERLFRDHGPTLAKVLRGQHRNFSGALA